MSQTTADDIAAIKVYTSIMMSDLAALNGNSEIINNNMMSIYSVIEGYVPEIYRVLGDMSSDVDYIFTDVNVIKEKATSIDNNVMSLYSVVEGNLPDINRVLGDMSSDVDYIFTDVNVIKEKADSIDYRLNSIESIGVEGVLALDKIGIGVYDVSDNVKSISSNQNVINSYLEGIYDYTYSIRDILEYFYSETMDNFAEEMQQVRSIAADVETIDYHVKNIDDNIASNVNSLLTNISADASSSDNTLSDILDFLLYTKFDTDSDSAILNDIFEKLSDVYKGIDSINNGVYGLIQNGVTDSSIRGIISDWNYTFFAPFTRSVESQLWHIGALLDTVPYINSNVRSIKEYLFDMSYDVINIDNTVKEYFPKFNEKLESIEYHTENMDSSLMSIDAGIDGLNDTLTEVIEPLLKQIRDGEKGDETTNLTNIESLISQNVGNTDSIALDVGGLPDFLQHEQWRHYAEHLSQIVGNTDSIALDVGGLPDFLTHERWQHYHEALSQIVGNTDSIDLNLIDFYNEWIEHSEKMEEFGSKVVGNTDNIEANTKSINEILNNIYDLMNESEDISLGDDDLSVTDITSESEHMKKIGEGADETIELAPPDLDVQDIAKVTGQADDSVESVTNSLSAVAEAVDKEIKATAEIITVKISSSSKVIKVTDEVKIYGTTLMPSLEMDFNSGTTLGGILSIVDNFWELAWKVLSGVICVSIIISDFKKVRQLFT